MKAKNHKLIEQCVEEGISWGFQRAYKHEDNPSRTYVRECIQECIMHEIFEWFDFGEPFDSP
jgi:hypothetical protein